MFEAVGGQPFFDRLVQRFYEHVAADPALLSLYPDRTTSAPPVNDWRLFLGQSGAAPTPIPSDEVILVCACATSPSVIDEAAGRALDRRDVLRSPPPCPRPRSTPSSPGPSRTG